MNEQMTLFQQQTVADLETKVRPAEQGRPPHPGKLYVQRGVFREPPTASKGAMEDIYRSNLAHALFQLYNGTTDPIKIGTPQLSGQSCSALAKEIVVEGKYHEAMEQLSLAERDDASKERVHEYLIQYARAVHSTATTNSGQIAYLDIHTVFLSGTRPERSGSLYTILRKTGM
jgi:hypothetical protein